MSETKQFAAAKQQQQKMTPKVYFHPQELSCNKLNDGTKENRSSNRNHDFKDTLAEAIHVCMSTCLPSADKAVPVLMAKLGLHAGATTIQVEQRGR